MAQSLISEELRLCLLEQFLHERYNASLYIQIAGYLQNKGLDKLGEKFLGQHDEEIGHSRLIYDFLIAMNAPFFVGEISEVKLDINSIMDIANAYLDREKLTTQNLNEIKLLTISEQNGTAEEFLRSMVNRQINELEEASNFYDNAELTGNDWWKVQMWDKALG